MDAGDPVDPGCGLLELAGQRQQGLLVTEPPGEVHADGQALVVPVQRQGDGGLAGHVEHRGEGHERGGPQEPVEGLVGRASRTSPSGTGGSPNVGDSNTS